MDLPKEDSIKQNDMSTVLQLVQDMRNRMIVYERKGLTLSSSLVQSSSSQAILRNQPTNSSFLNQPKAILSKAWCNLCDDNHDLRS
jgi:hypothetical protein